MQNLWKEITGLFYMYWVLGIEVGVGAHLANLCACYMYMQLMKYTHLVQIYMFAWL